MKLIFATLLLICQGNENQMESALGKVAERSYRINQNEQRIGSFKMKTRIEKAGDRKTVLLEDEMELLIGGEKSRISMKETAALQHLRLISGLRTANKVEWSVGIDGGKATMKVEGRENKVEVTDSTIGEQAVLRLVCTAEQKPGATIKVDVLSMTAERLEREHIFQCAGKESIDHLGKKIDVLKWEEKWEQKSTKDGVPVTSSVANTYWVSPDGVLYHFRGSGGLEMILEK